MVEAESDSLPCEYKIRYKTGGVIVKMFLNNTVS